jgi:hypothetical protein
MEEEEEEEEDSTVCSTFNKKSHCTVSVYHSMSDFFIKH